MNAVFLTGNLTKDPEARTTPNGTAVANFSIAYNHYNPNKPDENRVSYFEVKCFGKIAERMAQFKKGERVAIEASAEQERWENKEGQKTQRVCFNARSVVKLEKLSKNPENMVDKSDDEAF